MRLSLWIPAFAGMTTGTFGNQTSLNFMPLVPYGSQCLLDSMFMQCEL